MNLNMEALHGMIASMNWANDFFVVIVWSGVELYSVSVILMIDHLVCFPQFSGS